MSNSPLRVPVQSRSQRTRAALVTAASAEFGEKGYAPTTAKSICARAGVGTGTFYHYFPDKDAVLQEIARERVQYLLDATAPAVDVPLEDASGKPSMTDAVARLRQLVRVYVDYHRADRGLHEVITARRFCDPRIDSVMAASEDEGLARTARALAHWGYDGDSEVAAFMAFSLLEGAVHGHVLSHAVLDDARFVEGLVDALLRIAAPAALLAELHSTGRKNDD